MACSECKEVFDETKRFDNCLDSDCNILLCEVCLRSHFKKHSKELKSLYKSFRIELELLLKKVSLHVQYELVILGQINLVETEQLEQQLREYPEDEVNTLKTKTEERLKNLLIYQDTLNFWRISIHNDIVEMKTANSFERFMIYKNELGGKKQKVYSCIDVTIIEHEIEDGSTFEKLQNSINAAKISVRNLDANVHTVEQIINAVRSDLNMENMTTSLAVVGRMKSGKSEFINTFRGKKPKDENTAKVKMVECTMVPTPYEFVKGDHRVVLWDCPGFGSATKPQKGYINVLIELNCDVYLYFYNGAITENDEVILTEMKNKLKKEIFIARTHADEDYRKEFYNETGCEYEDAEKQLKVKHLEEVTKICRGCHQEEIKVNLFLKKVHWDQKVHYISCRLKWVDKFDYQELFKDICDSLPRIKRENILMVANTHVLHLLDEKKKLLSERISRISYAAAWERLIPFRNAYQQLIDSEVQYYLKVFDLNEDSIKLCGVNECLKNLWKEVDGLDLQVLDFRPAKDEINFKSIGLTVAMYAPLGLGTLIAWPVSKFTSEKYLIDQLENIYRISKASFERAHESIQHQYIYNQGTSNDK